MWPESQTEHWERDNEDIGAQTNKEILQGIRK